MSSFYLVTCLFHLKVVIIGVIDFYRYTEYLLGGHFVHSEAWCLYTHLVGHSMHLLSACGKIKCESVCFSTTLLCRCIQEEVTPVSTAGGSTTSNTKKTLFSSVFMNLFQSDRFPHSSKAKLFGIFCLYVEFLSSPLRFS